MIYAFIETSAAICFWCLSKTSELIEASLIKHHLGWIRSLSFSKYLLSLKALRTWPVIIQIWLTQLRLRNVSLFSVITGESAFNFIKEVWNLCMVMNKKLADFSPMCTSYFSTIFVIIWAVLYFCLIRLEKPLETGCNTEDKWALLIQTLCSCAHLMFLPESWS